MIWYWLAAATGEGTAPGGAAALVGLPADRLPLYTMWAIMAGFLALAVVATRRLERVPTTRLQAALEVVVEALIDFFAGIMGSRKKAVRYVPLLGTFFLFILVSNYSGLLPGAGQVFVPPTAKWSVTAGLAAIVFLTVQVEGVRAKGLAYFRHFVEPWFLAPLMIPLGIIEELVKPFSLSLRLFANIFGGETVLFVLLLSVPAVLPVGVLFLELIFGFIQAFIFTLLSAVYITNATAEDHH